MSKKSVKQRIEEALARNLKKPYDTSVPLQLNRRYDNSGRVMGKSQTRQERATSYKILAARGHGMKVPKPLQTDHKPRGYRPVPCKNNIRVQQYVRRGNEVVASHCRYK